MPENTGGIENDPVVDFGLAGYVSKIKVPTNAAAAFAFVEVAGVAVDF